MNQKNFKNTYLRYTNIAIDFIDKIEKLKIQLRHCFSNLKPKNSLLASLKIAHI